MRKIGLWLLALYRAFSYILPKGSCIFQPTCSKYAQQALKKHKFFKAFTLICWRILRCNPFNKGGFDPVR